MVQGDRLTLQEATLPSMVPAHRSAGSQSATPVKRASPPTTYHSSPCRQKSFGFTVASPNRAFISFALAGE
jgi:hypothetical protein